MGEAASPADRGHGPAAHDFAFEGWASRRRLYLDNLKVLLIAVVIAGHAVVGYSTFDWWSYADVREVTLSPVTVGLLMAVAIPLGMLVIPLLFLIAGLLTPPSVEHRGIDGYVRSRLLRLGVPFAVFAVLLWPYLEYLLFRVFGAVRTSYRGYLREEGTLDTGVLWFVGTLLVFSLLYAGGIRLVGGRGRGRPRLDEIRVRHLAAVAVVVTVTTFLLRLFLPFETDSPYLDLNQWEWPVCAALFALGIVGSRFGWVAALPDRLRRSSRAVTLVAVGVAAVFMVLVSVAGIDEEQLAGGWRWPALLFVTGECVIAVFGPVWLLGAAQQYLQRPLRWCGPAVGRSAYGAFLVQGLVLFTLAVALRPVPLPAEVKALTVAVAGLAGSFGLAWMLIRRVPFADRIL